MIALRQKVFIEDRSDLVFVKPNRIDADYWDKIWSESDLRAIHCQPGTDIVVRHVQRLVPRSARLLEAGCGDGRIVRQLWNLGYKVTGMDYAPQIVGKLNALFPELPVVCGDVRDTQFENESFDGYISIGVIEHFTETFEPVLGEAHRILKPGGHAFVSFPYMSPLRRLKACMGFYEQKPSIDDYCVAHFNQFALDIGNVIDTASQQGFQHVKSVTHNGVLGWCEEVRFLDSLMHRIYGSSNRYVRVLRAVLNRALAPVMSHSVIVIFRKK